MACLTDDARREFAEACHLAASMGLMRCSSGNMSWRFADGHMAVTATRTWLASIEPAEFAVVRIDNGEALTAVKPSVESAFHGGVLRHRPDWDVVLHFQTPCATAFACGTPMPGRHFYVIPEIPYYIGEPGWVGFAMPGSPELADLVIEAMRTHDLVLLQNHGLVTGGKDFRDVVQKAAFFELACELMLKDIELRLLPDAAVTELLERGRASRAGRVTAV